MSIAGHIPPRQDPKGRRGSVVHQQRSANKRLMQTDNSDLLSKQYQTFHRTHTALSGSHMLPNYNLN